FFGRGEMVCPEVSVCPKHSNIWIGLKRNYFSIRPQGDGSFVLFFSSLCCKNFAPGVRKCQGQREKKQQGNIPRNAKGYRSSGHC
ncbi:MAG: hypothetical protein WAQ97_00005, partial [bacterium]